MVLTPTQFSVWHSKYMDLCHHQAAENNHKDTPVQLNMLLRTDEFETAEEQAEMDPFVFIQCSQAALCALKMVAEAKAWGQGCFINIRQGATEAYLHFIDRLQEAIQKHIENQEAAYTLVLQLDYENANNDCKAVLNPPKLTPTSISQFISLPKRRPGTTSSHMASGSHKRRN